MQQWFYFFKYFVSHSKFVVKFINSLVAQVYRGIAHLFYGIRLGALKNAAPWHDKRADSSPSPSHRRHPPFIQHMTVRVKCLPGCLPICSPASALRAV